MPIRRCAPIPACWRRTAAGNPACGAIPSPATCRSCCCRSPTPANIELVRQIVQAHAYWRLKGLAVDLMIWNEDHSGYRQDLQDQILGLISAGADGIVKDQPGGIFVRPSDQMSDEDRILFQAVARVILSDSRGTLAEQVASADEAGARCRAELAPVRGRTGRRAPFQPRRAAT